MINHAVATQHVEGSQVVPGVECFVVGATPASCPRRFVVDHGMLVVSNAEFAEIARGVRIPHGWGRKVAIALSGGSDSTCLLFLYRRLLVSSEAQGVFLKHPPQLVSLTVDHLVQASSTQTAQLTRDYSHSQCVPNLVLKIPWGTPPFPERPPPGAAFENIARRARYHLLLSAMKEQGATTLILGHHLDDQVETAIMRLGRGSGLVGLGGMRQVRRWGMGETDALKSDYGWAGLDGMRTWIARPLLDIPKDRILATCRENNIPYVEDITNSQPSVTLRNEIRSLVYDANAQLDLSAPSSSVSSSIDRALSLASALHPTGHGIFGKTALLRTWVQNGGDKVRQLDQQVSDYLASHRSPSPPSTFLLVPSPSSKQHIPSLSSDSKRAIILRILRYISPNPWGSLAAESGRRTATLDLIVNRLWPDSAPNPNFTQDRHDVPKRFSAGSQVLWTPVIVLPDGRIRLQTRARGVDDEGEEGRIYGWLASRQPPVRQRGHARDAIVRATPADFEVDITKVVAQLGVAPLQSSPPTSSSLSVPKNDDAILFDNRFSLRFHHPPPSLPSSLQQNQDRVVVVPHGRYHLPRVVRRPHRLEGDVETIEDEVLANVPALPDTIHKKDEEWECDLGWVTIKFVRVLDAI